MQYLHKKSFKNQGTNIIQKVCKKKKTPKKPTNTKDNQQPWILNIKTTTLYHSTTDTIQPISCLISRNHFLTATFPVSPALNNYLYF